MLIVSMSIGSKERGIERINAASKDYDATVFDIRQDGFVNISLLTSRFQVFKLVGIRVLMETGGIKRLTLQENMQLVGMKSRVNGITYNQRYLVTESMEKMEQSLVLFDRLWCIC